MKKVFTALLVLSGFLFPSYGYADWTYTVTNAITPITYPAGATGAATVTVRENSTSPSATFTIWAGPNPVVTTQTGVALGVGQAYTFTAPTNSPFTGGQVIGYIQAGSAGPFTFAAIVSAQSAGAVSFSQLAGLLTPQQVSSGLSNGECFGYNSAIPTSVVMFECSGGGGGSSIFTSYQFGANTAITGSGNYFQLAYDSNFNPTYSGSGTVGSPFVATLSLANVINAVTGFTVGGAAAANHLLVGNATAYVDAAALPTAALPTGWNPVTNTHLQNSSITFNGTANQLTSPGATSLGGTATYGLANPLTFPGKWTGAATTTSAATANIPAGTAPSSPVLGDLWNPGTTLVFYDGTAARTLVATGTCATNSVATSLTSTGPGCTALTGAYLPNPSATTLGGIESITSAANKWITYIDTSGVPHQAQPADTNISGTTAGATLYVTAGALAELSTTAYGILSAGATNPAWITPPATKGIFYAGWNLSSDASAAPSYLQVGFSGRAVSGTSDTILYSDVGRAVEYTGSAGVAVTLPTATTLENPSMGFAVWNETTGSSTVVTVTPTTWQVNGAASLAVAQGQFCTIFVDPAGGAWDATCREPALTAGTDITLTRSSGSLQIGLTSASVTVNGQAATLGGSGVNVNTGATAGTLAVNNGNGNALTGLGGAGADYIPVTSAANTWTSTQVNGGADCGDGTHAVKFTAATGTFGCQTLTTGGAGTVTSITFSAPLSSTSNPLTASGTVSITGVIGEVLAGATPAFTATPTLAEAAAPSTPASSYGIFWQDSTDHRFHDKNPSGTIGTTVTADAGATHKFLTAISAAGVISKAQPADTDISGTTAGSLLTVTAGALAEISPGSQYQVMVMGASTPGWGAVSLAQSGSVTGQLPVANGGTACASASITCFNNISGFSAAGTTGTTSTNLVFSGGPTFTGTLSAAALSTTGVDTFTPAARTSGAAAYFQLTIPTDTGQTAATESPGFQTVTATRTWASTGTVATQREFLFVAPTYASASATQTFTKAATLAISGAPIAGTNAAITNAYALWVQGGNAQFDGGLTSTTGTFTGTLTAQNGSSFGGTAYSYGAPSATGGAAIVVPATTYTVTGTATTANFQGIYQGAATFTDASAGTVTDAFGMVLAGPAAAAGSLTITRAHTFGILDSTSATSAITGAFQVCSTFGTAAGCVGIGAGNIYAGANGFFAGTLGATGHVTFEGVTSTGATGTGALVFGTSPTFTTGITSPVANLTATTNQIITGASSNLTTVTFPASSGAVTVTMPNTTTSVVSAASALTANLPVVGSGNAASATLAIAPTSITTTCTGNNVVNAASAYQASWTVTTTGSCALELNNLQSGGFYTIYVTQGSGGSHTLALTAGDSCTAWKVSGDGSGAVTPTTTAGALDIMTVAYDGTNCYVNYNKNFN
jgi:hypothetical protein